MIRRERRRLIGGKGEKGMIQVRCRHGRPIYPLQDTKPRFLIKKTDCNIEREIQSFFIHSNHVTITVGAFQKQG